MKSNNVWMLLIVILSLSRAFAVQARELSVSNGDFKASLELRSGRIEDLGLFGENGLSMSADSGMPVFEFCVNNEVLRSDMPIWRYEGSESRVLDNGGKLTSFYFRGKGRFKSLHLCWDRELFPTSAFLRERLRMRCDDASMRLTNVGGHNHFIFPRYSLKAGTVVEAKELRMGSFRPKRSMADHHMNHPDSLFYVLGPEPVHTKGPFLIMDTGAGAVWTAYEHASQDKAFTARRSRTQSKGTSNDGLQGTQGDLDEVTEDALWFISTDASLKDGELVVGNHIRRGGYLDGELIPTEGWYETVWSVISFENGLDDVNRSIGEYLFTRITDNPQSRIPDFYYNTWGMQRDVPSDSMYVVMNEKRLLEEIDLAAECGVRTFVIDDGWHVTFGDWRYNRERFPNSLAPLVGRMREKGITPGIWLSLCGAGKETRRTAQHPEWIIKDRSGEPILAQWGNPVYDLVGPFYDVLLSDLKALIDEGFRFFKWDGINLFSSDLCGLGHGDESNSRQERIDRYNYLFPFYVTRLMREMREYCPGTVVEIDLTEMERNLVGLMLLQEGKFYFINNGASKYRDYGAKRTRSVRSTINEYAFFMPQELFTYAVYPRADAGTLDYNITTAIQAGHGIWGDLVPTDKSRRDYIRWMFNNAEKIFPHVKGHLVEVSGTVHDTPETYLQRDADSGYALFTAFGDTSYEGAEHIRMNMSKVLGVVGCPFCTDDESVVLGVNFCGDGPQSMKAFIFGITDGCGFRIMSSTASLNSIEYLPGRLRLVADTAGDIKLLMPDGKVRECHLEANSPVIFEERQ